jgi:hypothetical protein
MFLYSVLRYDCVARHHAYLTGMTPSSTGSTLRGWRRNYVGAYIMEFNGHAIFNSLNFVSACALVHLVHLMVPHPTLSLTLAPGRQEALCNPGVYPRLHLDQFHPVICILSKIGEGRALSDAYLPDDYELISVIQSVAAQGRSAPLPSPLPDLQNSGPNYEIGTQPGSKWTRGKLRKLPYWSRWKLAETTQLKRMDKDGMYGPPCKRPDGAVVLHQVWTYNVKYEGTLKTPNCCDGSVLKGRGIEYARHYTTCI